jgi:hypothetical protein
VQAQHIIIMHICIMLLHIALQAILNCWLGIGRVAFRNSFCKSSRVQCTQDFLQSQVLLQKYFQNDEILL